MTDTFPTVGRWRTGYDRTQVDRFFADARGVYERRSGELISGREVRHTAFDLVRGGYATVPVDAALDRLERAFVVQQREEFVATHGRRAWMEHLATQARTLYGRLTRADGERFAPPQRNEFGYARGDVDALCRRLVAYFDDGTPLTSDEVRYATFRRARGRSAYAEAPVDAFLDRAVEVLLGVE